MTTKLAQRLFALTFYATAAVPALAAQTDFFDAALCKPPVITDSVNDLNFAAEGVYAPLRPQPYAIHPLSASIKRDEFTANEVVFSRNSMGVLVHGKRAAELADRYDLTQDRVNYQGAKRYSRALPAEQQPLPELGVVSIMAQENPAYPDKTMLMCEFVSHLALKALTSQEAKK